MRQQRPSLWRLVGAGLLTGLLLLIGLVAGFVLYFLAFLDEFDTSTHRAPGAESARHFWSGAGIAYLAFLVILGSLFALVALMAREGGWSGRIVLAVGALGLLSQPVALHLTLLYEASPAWLVAAWTEVVALPVVLVTLAWTVRTHGPAAAGARPAVV